METIRRILVALALPLAIAACSGTNLPTHRDWGGASPLAPETGRLVLSGDCVSLVDSRTGGSWLVVWPPGTSRNGADNVGSGGNPLAQIGDEVTLVGGEYQADVVGSQLTAPIPSECQTDLYWLVGDLTVDVSPAASPYAAVREHGTPVRMTLDQTIESSNPSSPGGYLTASIGGQLFASSSWSNLWAASSIDLCRHSAAR